MTNPYIDYSTVAIGIYAGAAGMSPETILTIQNEYAKQFSKFANGTIFDNTYKYLPKKNLLNTINGYKYYRSFKK